MVLGFLDFSTTSTFSTSGMSKSTRLDLGPGFGLSIFVLGASSRFSMFSSYNSSFLAVRFNFLSSSGLCLVGPALLKFLPTISPFIRLNRNPAGNHCLGLVMTPQLIHAHLADNLHMSVDTA